MFSHQVAGLFWGVPQKFSTEKAAWQICSTGEKMSFLVGVWWTALLFGHETVGNKAELLLGAAYLGEITFSLWKCDFCVWLCFTMERLCLAFPCTVILLIDCDCAHNFYVLLTTLMIWCNSIMYGAWGQKYTIFLKCVDSTSTLWNIPLWMVLLGTLHLFAQQLWFSGFLLMYGAYERTCPILLPLDYCHLSCQPWLFSDENCLPDIISLNWDL